MEYPVSIESLCSDAGSALYALKHRHFVLWDTADERAWLVNGPVVALLLIRSYIKARGAKFDFSKLNHIEDKTPSAAFDVLNDQENMKMVVFPKAKDSKENSSAVTLSEKDKDDKESSLEHICFNVYKVLLLMSRASIDLIDKTGNNIADWFQTWVGKRWETKVKGWDFQLISQANEPYPYIQKIRGNPGWLGLVKELQATILFGHSFGEIIRPDNGHCCPYFRTLPKGKNYLAVGMSTIQARVNSEGAAAQADGTVAKLSHHFAWERDVDPFNHPHGQSDHLEKVDPSCFPVQRLVGIPDYGNRTQKDKDLVTKSKGRLYSWKDVDEMNTTATDVGKRTIDKSLKSGVVVFGRKPDREELRQLAKAKANATARVGSPSRTPAQQPQTWPTQQPPSTRSLGSDMSTVAARSGATSADGQAQSSLAPAGTASSVTSIRSIGSSTHRRTSGAGAGAEQPRASTPQASIAVARRAASTAGLRSTTSITRHDAPSATSGAGHARTASSENLVSSAHRTASNASLRSTSSNSRSHPTIPGSSSGRPEATTAEASATTATRKPSSSSVRTTSSADSKASRSLQTQAPAEQPPTPYLKKTNTQSSDTTTSSRSSRGTQNSTTGSTADTRRRQQRLDHQAATTEAGGVTGGYHPTSSGPSHTEGGGADGSN